MKKLTNILISLLFVCILAFVCEIRSFAQADDASKLSAWIQMADELLSEEKDYISGLPEFESALAAAKSGGDEDILIANLKSAWQNLWYTERTQISIPDTYSLNRTNESLGTHYSEKTNYQLKFQWKVPSGDKYWSNAVSIDFYVCGHRTLSESQAPSETSANLSFKFTGSNAYSYIGSTYKITNKRFATTLKQFVIPVSKFADVLSEKDYASELLILETANSSVENTLTVSSLFITKKYQEVLPCEPATILEENESVRYGTKTFFSVPAGCSAYYTTDGSEPTVSSELCYDGQEFTILSDSLKILTVAEDFKNSVVDYTFDLNYVTRETLLSEIENKYGLDISIYSDMNDIEFAASALTMEKGALSDAEYKEFLNIADSFSATSVMNIKSSDLREILKKHSSYSDLEITDYYDNEILEFIKSADTSLQTQLVQKEFEIICKYVDSAIKVSVKDNILNGSVKINGIFACDNEKVLIKLNPEIGFRIKSDSLVVYIDGIPSVLPTRCGFRDNIVNSDIFEFYMPTGCELAVISVEYERVDSSPLSHIQRTIVENYTNSTDALRFIFRCYLSSDIRNYGIIATSKETFDNSSATDFDLGYSGKMVRIDSRDRNFSIYDQCGKYVDFSLAMVYSSESPNKAKDVIARSYVVMNDGTVFYSYLVACSYSDISNKCLSANKSIYDDPCGSNSKILSVSSNNSSFVNGKKTEFDVEIASMQGNTYDDDEISLDLILNGPDGSTVTVPGFYYDNQLWKIRFVPQNAGVWKYSVVLKENGVITDTVTGYLQVSEIEEEQKGNITISSDNSSRFSFSDGSEYIPVGMNVAWQGTAEDYKHYIDAISDDGGNYMRIWLTDYGLTLFNNISEPDNYLPTINNAKELDEVIEYAENKGVYLQIAILNHELFIEDIDWINNPFNSGNNGYLDDPSEFWTDSQALEDTKDYIRYLLARYGYSPAVFSWEICNEVTSCKGDKNLIDERCQEIADYIKSFDCYKQLVSNSCANPTDAKLNADYLDFINLHIYSYTSLNKVIEYVSAFGAEKPVLVSEIGVDYSSIDGIVDTDILRHDCWAGIMSGSAGGAASWYWNTIDSLLGNDAYAIFGTAYEFAKEIPFEENLTAINGTVSNGVKYMGYSGENGMWLWVYDSNAVTTVNNLTPTITNQTQTNISLEIANGTYTVEVYDTVSGVITDSRQVSVSNGLIDIIINDWNSDVAIVIY